MERGSRLEPEALSAFEFETGKKFERVGLIQDDTNDNIAQSPDGYIEDTDDTEAGEAKCPGGKNYVKLWLTNKVPDDYEWQVTQYFVVNPKLKILWFIGYNPDITVHPLHIIKVTRESLTDKIVEARKEQEEFLQEVEEKLSKIITL